MNATLRKVDIDQLHDLYQAESELVDTLATLAEAADDPVLKKSFLFQRKRSRAHALQLKKLCESLENKTAAGRSRAIAGLLALLASLKAEHQTVAEYTCSQTLARALGFHAQETMTPFAFGAGQMPSRLRLCRE